MKAPIFPSCSLFLLSFLLLTACGGPPKEPENVPEGMLYVRGGKIMIGSEEGGPQEQPVFETTVEPFLIDRSPVTVAQFRAFVQATGYRTKAEEFGDAGVLNMETKQWELRPGAYWAYPLGPEGPPAADDHPVTQISWYDATAYCQWAGKRLPTEIEWEYAARSGLNDGKQFCWGNELVEDGQYKANVWQGFFPAYNDTSDGFLYTSPVGFFGSNPLGLTDMGGNVWEWTADVYRLYEGNPTPFKINPEDMALRGGSFLCDEKVCFNYRVSSRTFMSKESANFHNGFRCAKDL